MSQLDQLLQKRVNRRQFLKMLGAGTISLLGLSAITGLLTTGDDNVSNLPGYGRADYGP